MASQVAHIIYAQKYFVKHPSRINKDEFMLGCVFPDIRRIDENISRLSTHGRFESLDLNFEGLAAFEAGWKFHAYCDMRREGILKDYGFFDLPETGKIYGTPNKLLEDELVYDGYDNWEKVRLFFNNVRRIENDLGISQETIGMWYSILATYFERRPDDKSMHAFASKLPKLAPYADGIVETVDKLRKNDKVIEILKKVREEMV